MCMVGVSTYLGNSDVIQDTYLLLTQQSNGLQLYPGTQQPNKHRKGQATN